MRRRRRVAPVPHGDERGPQRLVHAPAVDDEQATRRRQRDQTELELDAEEQRPLGTGDQPAEIERPVARRIEAAGVEQRVEGVAGVAPGHLGPGKGIADQPPRVRVAEQPGDLAVDAGLERVGAGGLGEEFRRRERSEGHRRPVGEKAAGRDKVIAGRAVGDRVRPAGVVPHHPADHRPRGRRGLRAEVQPVGGEEPVELVADDAGLDADAAGGDIDRQDPVHPPAGIDDDPRTDHLPGQRRPGGPGDQADPLGRREPDQFLHVAVSGGQGHRQRPLLVLGGVGRVDRPGDVVPPQFARQPAGERPQAVGQGAGDGRGCAGGHRPHHRRNSAPIHPRSVPVTCRSVGGRVRRRPCLPRCAAP